MPNLKCPDIVETRTLFVSATADSREILDYEISFGQYDVMELMAIMVDAYIDSTGLTGSAQIQVGISHNEQNRTTVTNQGAAIFAARDDMIAVFNFGHRIITAVGQEKFHYHRIVYFNPTVCLVRSPSLEVNMRSQTANWANEFFVTLFYYKKGVVKNVITQLFKIYQDAKGIFKSTESG